MPATRGEPFITNATVASLRDVRHARPAFPRREPARVAARSKISGWGIDARRPPAQQDRRVLDSPLPRDRRAPRLGGGRPYRRRCGVRFGVLPDAGEAIAVENRLMVAARDQIRDLTSRTRQVQGSCHDALPGGAAHPCRLSHVTRTSVGRSDHPDLAVVSEVREAQMRTTALAAFAADLAATSALAGSVTAARTRGG